MSYGGETPSTLSDVLRYVVALYVEIGPAHATGTTYAAGATVAANGRVYTCHAGGVAAEAPSGPGSYVDANGVGWYPLFYSGDRFDAQEGAPPRIYFRRSKAAGSVGPVLEIGSRQIGSFGESVIAHIWGAESESDDEARYDNALAMGARLMAAFNAAGVGRLTLVRMERDSQTSVVTFGEQYQLEVGYVWAIPRDEAIEIAARALAQAAEDAGEFPQSPPDPDRPNGPSTVTFQNQIVMENERP